MQGTQIDYFGLVAVEGNDAKVELKGSGLNPSQESAQAANRRGDIIAHHEYNKRKAPSTTYTVIGEFVLSQLSIGKKYSYPAQNPTMHYILTEVSVSTQNGSALPELSLKSSPVPADYDDSGDYAQLQLPAITVAATFAAQNLAFAANPITAGGDITKATWSAKANMAEAKGSDGEVIAAAPYGVVYEQQVDFVVTGDNVAPEVTPPEGYVLTAEPALDETNTDYASGSFTITSYGVRADPEPAP
jgi:hypothetical protein